MRLREEKKDLAALGALAQPCWNSGLDGRSGKNQSRDTSAANAAIVIVLIRVRFRRGADR